jgi:4-amino-4-deoxy-L-arabinose transferase-like glycosyltransferase
MTSASNSNPRRALSPADLACVAAVAGLRLVLLATARADPVFRVPYLDSAFYDTWARSLAAGHGDFQGPYFLAPLYPHLLAALYRVAGPDPWNARILQSVLGVATALLVLVLGRRLFGPGSARLAVVLYGLYGPLAFYENLLVLESWLVALAFASVCAALLLPGPRLVRGATSGALLGLATLARPTALVALPVVLLALRPAGRPRRDRSVLACVAATLLVLAPVVARNLRMGGGLVVATNGGVNFYAGNNPQANGRFREPPGLRFFRDPTFVAARSADLPPAVAARALTVRAVAGDESAADSGAWTRRAIDWMAAHPVHAAGLLLRKVWLVLQAREIPQIESYAFHAGRIGALRAFGVDFGWLWPLAALGLWCARRERLPGWRLLAGLGAALLVPCLVFFVTERYRLAIVPVAALFAGLGGLRLLGLARRGPRRHLAIALAALAPIALAARSGARPPSGAGGWEQAQMAERLYALGDLEAAIEFQERAARSLPQRFEPALNLALYWSERARPGDGERALALLRRLAERWPREAVVQHNLGLVARDQGQLDTAREAWRRALAADPGFEPARMELRRLKDVQN